MLSKAVLPTIAIVTTLAACPVKSWATPSDSVAQGCVSSLDQFEIAVIDIKKRDVTKRTCGSSDSLILDLKDGVLTDGLGRTGCIVANYQFQFDGPPQSGTMYSNGWSVCNGDLNLNGGSTFYKCPSGRPDGTTFYNLYDRKWAEHCEPHYLQVIPCIDASGSISSPPVNQIDDGQLQSGSGSSSPKTTIAQIGDSQPQASKTLGSGASAVTQIGDGQLQAGKTSGSGASAVTQIGDGQLQAGKTSGSGASTVTQTGGGQLQAGNTSGSGASTVTQVGGGQLQAGKTSSASGYTASGGSDSSKTIISQITDGQIQAGKTSTTPMVHTSTFSVSPSPTYTSMPYTSTPSYTSSYTWTPAPIPTPTTITVCTTCTMTETTTKVSTHAKTTSKSKSCTDSKSCTSSKSCTNTKSCTSSKSSKTTPYPTPKYTPTTCPYGQAQCPAIAPVLRRADSGSENAKQVPVMMGLGLGAAALLFH